MVLSAVLMAGATHYTTPWYIAIPILLVAFGARFVLYRRRRSSGGSGRGGWGGRGGRGPFGRGPYDGSGDDT
jgi:hypothetical protein